jgi:ATPase subunit of ABC transporter with duplicated ATPase domains
MGNKRLYDIMKEKDALYMKPDFSDEDGVRAAELEGEFAEQNGWNAEADAESLLNGLGIETELHHLQMESLDGPQKVKVLLAQALFGNRMSFFSMSRRTTWIWWRSNGWRSF